LYNSYHIKNTDKNTDELFTKKDVEMEVTNNKSNTKKSDSQNQISLLGKSPILPAPQ
jgi:hypothetical protein